MRVTVVRTDGVVGVDGIFRQVDLSTMPEDIRVMQWTGESGHIEYTDPTVNPNTRIDKIAEIQSFIDLWTNAAPPPPQPPTSAQLIAAAHERLNAAYEAEINSLTAGYPSTEIASWPKQEAEARAFVADASATAPWLRSAAIERGLSVEELAQLVIANADALAPLHGAATGKRQRLRDEIDALGDDATQEELDAIQW